MKRTPSLTSSIFIIGLFFLCFVLTPSLAEASIIGNDSQLFSSEAETNDISHSSSDLSSKTNTTDGSSSAVISSESPSLSAEPPSDTLNNKDDSYSNVTATVSPNKDYDDELYQTALKKKEEKQEYKISAANKFIVCVFGVSVIVSILLLVKNHREHTNQLAELRREQQERREQQQTRRQESLQDRRKKIFCQRFHFTVISEDGSNINNAGSKVLSVKQGHANNGPSADGHDDDDDVEAPSVDNDDNDATAGDTTSNTTAKERPRLTAVSSTGNFFHHFWKKQASNECSICLGDYCPGDTVCVAKAARCNHVFHQDCIAEWLKKSDCCPLCRVNLMDDY